jgi:hypothetical protein
MKGMNEQSSIRMEDLTLYPYCTSFERESKAKVKLRDNNNTLFINREYNRDTDAMRTKFRHCRWKCERGLSTLWVTYLLQWLTTTRVMDARG